MKINVLEPRIYNKISAGEVVERPASIVKELVENSIDAGAKNIRIEIEGGGIKNITVADDGHGIEKEDLTVAFMPHATSKIKTENDLDGIISLGFRGEALASISAVCQVKLSSKTEESNVGYSIKVDGGIFGKVSEIARAKGTTITCENLFFNTPARLKFLRKPKFEESEITHLVEKFMLANSNIAFQYYVDGKQVYNTVSCSMRDIIYTIYGNEIYENLVDVKYEENGYLICGYVTKPKVSRSNRTYQTLFVNGRCVENQTISSAVSYVYESFLMKGRFPIYVISIQVPPNSVDVNIHPSKKEVKFENNNKIFGMVRKAVENALTGIDQIQSFSLPDSIFENKKPKSDLKQKELLKIENLFDLQSVQISKIAQEEGRSFNADLLDSDEIQVKPYEFDIMANGNEYQQNNKQKDIFEKIADLEGNKEEQTLLSTKPNTKIYFDQSDECFMREIEKESFLKASVKNEMKILGTLFKTYIVVEYADSVYFIDQHAGHERLLYDKVVKNVNENNTAKQMLLAPYTFFVGAKESQLLDQISEGLGKIGFDIVKDGYNYSITSVPNLLSFINLSDFVDDILSDILIFDKKPSDFIHEKLCQTACKHAIKAGDTITNDECAYIIEEVRKGVMLCPHGRPITLIITKHEFEKMFKRIV